MATGKLQQLDINNITLQTISSLNDVTVTERYDAITIGAGSLDSVPENLKNALAIGGRLFAITGSAPAKQAQLISRIGQTEWKVENLFETDIPDID